MSFMSTLAKVAVGLVAARGVQQFQKKGGMSGMQDMMKNASASGSSMTDQIGQMAERMGIPGGSKAVNDMLASFGMGGAKSSDDTPEKVASATHTKGMANPEQGATGLGSLMNAMGGAAAASGQKADEMMSGMFANTPAAVATENNAKLMIRSMIQAAKADGKIDEEEQKKILSQLQDAPEEEIAYVKEQLAAPLDIQALANDTGESMKAQVYATSLMSIRVDHESEVTYLKNLATALGLSDETRDKVHTAMGLGTFKA